MGSFSENKPDRNPDRNRGRRSMKQRRTRALIGMETLEYRKLLAFAGSGVPTWQPTSQDPLDATHGPLANAGSLLQTVYKEFQAFKLAGNNKPIDYFTPSNPNVQTRSGYVRVTISGYGDINALADTLTGSTYGMFITAKDNQFGLIEGFASPDNLPKIAQLRTTSNGQPMGVVSLSATLKPFSKSQGSANNQAEDVWDLANVLPQFPVNGSAVNGSGVTVGVISTSVNKVGGGLQDSINSGDLPDMSRITVVRDGNINTDEGRAMMELIYDLAPGVNLAYSDGDSQLNFAASVRNLSAIGSQVLVDDLGYADEPFFQPGPIEQAIADVVNNNNRVYFSAAGNDAQGGFASAWRSTSATIAGITGTWMDFDPGAGVVSQLPLTVGAGSAAFTFQFDQSWYTANGVTSNVDVYVLNSAGTVVASGTTDNTATQQPIELVGYNGDAIPAGSYTVAINVKSGPAPTFIQMASLGGGTNVTFSHQFDSSPGISHPTVFGHPASYDPVTGKIYSIAVGAVPFFNAPPFNTTSQVNNDDFSSFGPRYYAFTANGTRVSLKSVQGPLISGIDGVNTSFFGSDIPQDPDTLPNFFGTSAASPNAAAIAALMLQLSPGTSATDIANAMKSTATPLNGATAGSWHAQGGYGLINVKGALNAVSNLRVNTTTPASGDTLTSLDQLQTITVNFSKPINPSSIKTSDLVFTTLPTGVTATVLNVTASGSTAVFTVSVTRAPGANANGAYTFRVGGPGSSVIATDGKTLVPYTASLTVADLTSPTILGTTYVGRTITIQFSEAMDPATIIPTYVKLLRGSTLGTDLSTLNGYSVQWFANYNGLTNVAVIDLTLLDQTLLPTDRYAIYVSDLATDLTGNRLDGEFNGTFPTGDNKGQPAENTDNDSFVEDLGVLVLQAPYMLSLNLAPASDTGVSGDSNTKAQRPYFVGQISSQFPQAVAGLQVVVQFRSLHNNVFDLVQGANGRGYQVATGIDASAITDVSGSFTFQAPANLPDGFQAVRVIVVGKADQSGLPGLSSLTDKSFRVDTSLPLIAPVGITQGAKISALTGGITLSVTDPVLPAGSSPLSVPIQLKLPALDPATASNVSNYVLINTGALDGSTTTAIDYSSYIIGAVFTDTSNRVNTYDPYTGRVQLSFAPGLPAGRYQLRVRGQSSTQSGLTDAAGNPIDGDPGTAGAQDLVLAFDLQPTPTYVSSVQALSPDALGQLTVITGPRDFYEIPAAGVTARAPAPPSKFYVDFSGPLDLNTNYTDRVWLIRSADSVGGTADGDFGRDTSYAGAAGFTRVTGVTVNLVNSVIGAVYGQVGYKNRLEITIPSGTTLPADYYRLYIPNRTLNGTDLSVKDLYGNQLDGEDLGNPTSTGAWETLLPNGQYRAGMSGDGVDGGSFLTAFTVAANGNVIFARPDYTEDPFLPETYADGSLAKPYPVLAPQALPNATNGGNLNSPANFGTGFNPNIDIAGLGRFASSAFYAASQLSGNGPVVIVALPANTGDPLHRTFVLRQPNQDLSKPTIPDGSASVPAGTMLVMQGGSILKMYNASLFVQNQGSSIQMRGGASPNQQVIVTSYYDSTAGGNTSNSGVGVVPKAGDFGGIVLRNFDDVSNGGRTVPTAIGPDDPNRPNLYGRTKLGLSGADEAMSYFNYGQIRYGGGAVPNTNGFRYDAITLFNARPAITNMSLDGRQPTNSGAGGSQAGISADMDSLREDAISRGLLVRRTTVKNTSINGIYLRAELNGVIEPTNAVFYVNNGAGEGGAQNYTLDDPLPYVYTARMVLGQRLLQSSNLQEGSFTSRLYVQPGMVLKFQRGAAIDIVNPGSSLNVGDRTYLNQFDANNAIAPTDANFVPQHTGDARIVFTSFFDDNAFSEYVDPVTGVRTQIVAPLDSDNGGTVNQPTAGNVPTLARWGSIAVVSGARVVIDEADIRFGGGTVNQQGGTIGQRDVLHLGAATGGSGQRVYITNNNFTDNQGAPMDIDANGLLAADPLRPLQSGNPFFRGNVMQRNDVNGLQVYSGVAMFPGTANANLFYNSVWDDTDLTYVLRTTIVLAGSGPILPGLTFVQQPKPAITLTLQSSLPDSLLANGDHVAKPGESLIVKLLNDLGALPLGDGVNGTPANISSDFQGGAGFLVGVDDGVDPTTDPLIDEGWFSQIRITGIGGNETTGQTRVPVILTSLRDDSVGRTVRGVTMNQGASATYLAGAGYAGTAAAAGDGGVINFGANSLSDYNLLDPRDGNIIDNADIRYMTRIDVQGGGWAYSWGTTDALAQTDATGGVKTGVATSPDSPNSPDPWYQLNTAKAMSISNSNLAYFSQVGVISHRSGVGQIHIQKHPADGTPQIARGTFPGEPVLLYMVNNTISNMPTGVRIVSDIENNDQSPSPYAGIFQNNTFYNTTVGISTQSPAYNGLNPNAHTVILGLDNIFANITDVAVRIVGQGTGSQLLYNLFSNTPTPTDIGSAQFVLGPFNAQPVFGNASFRNAAGLDFSLNADSDAIDSSLSEVKQSIWGTYLQPIAQQQTDGTFGVRNTSGRARVQASGGNFDVSRPGDIVTLPGFAPGNRGYYDQWIPNGTVGQTGSTSLASSYTYSYTPMTGERDSLGYLRVDDPSRANVGFGSRPFFDIGAYEYRQLVGPRVTDVLANLPNNATVPIDPADPKTTRIYVSGGIGGVNQSPNDIRIYVDQQIDPTTITSNTVLLQSSGGDGIFGNANNSQDRYISLSGKLSYDPGSPATGTTPEVKPSIVVHLGELGLNLTDDLYRITVRGSGGEVVRNSQGLGLDGENTPNDDPDGVQGDLPTGDGIPGGNFFVTFNVKTTAPSIVSGTFDMAPDADLHPNDHITSDNTPTFIGTITDVPPPVNPLVGQTVIIDVSTKGYDANGNIVWDALNAGTGTTDSSGNFSVTLTTPLPDTAFNVGPDGILGTADDSGYSVARVRVISPSGNASNPDDPNARVSFVIDTKGPRILATDPVDGKLVTVNNGSLTVAVVSNENIDPATLTSSSIKVVRSGGDGVFDNGNDVAVNVDLSSINIEYLKTAMGAEIIRFNLTGLTTNDLYRVTLVGTGGGATDLAGNLVDGETPNGLPSGDGVPGGDFNFNFIVLDPNLVHTLYVDASQNHASPTGNRFNAFSTIGAAMAAAGLGDTIAVVGGSASSSYVTYNETVYMKSLIQLVSADPSSTDSSLVPGIALKTVIRSPLGASVPVAIVASNLISLTNFPTRISGFSIANPLTGGTATGPIQTSTVGIWVDNSDILIDRNYIMTSGSGVLVNTHDLARAPRLYSNVVTGNINGVVLTDVSGSTTGFQGIHSTTQVINNTVAWNTNGMVVQTDANGPLLADVQNNIFWQNAERTVSRAGSAITSSNVNRITVKSNMFSSNGPSASSPTDDTVNVGNGFNPSLLTTTKTDALGNYVGNPAFVSPLDPRPDGQGPGNFWMGANYDLTANSAAIDNGSSQAVVTPTANLDTDFRYRTRVDIPSKGFSTRIVDVGAFEYNGLNAQAQAPVQAGGSYGNGIIRTNGVSFGSAISIVATSTTSITIRFASTPNRSSVKASDLLLSGAGLKASNAAYAKSVTWIDNRTVRFNLSTALTPRTKVQVDFAPGAMAFANRKQTPSYSKVITVPNVVTKQTGGRTRHNARTNVPRVSVPKTPRLR